MTFDIKLSKTAYFHFQKIPNMVDKVRPDQTSEVLHGLLASFRDIKSS